MFDKSVEAVKGLVDACKEINPAVRLRAVRRRPGRRDDGDALKPAYVLDCRD